MRSGNSSRNWSHNGSMTEDGSAGTSTSAKEGDVRHPFCYRGSCLSCAQGNRRSATEARACPASRTRAYPRNLLVHELVDERQHVGAVHAEDPTGAAT